MVRKTFDLKGLTYVSELIILNLKDTLKVLDWNIKNKIYIYRMSSDSFPWMSEYNFESLPNFKVISQLPKEDQEDINKLFGYTLGFNHHKDSARFGWFYQDNTIHLHAYVYDNGVRKSKLIKNLDLNTVLV